MEFKEMNLTDQIKVVAHKLNKDEFSEWLHKQVIMLAEHMQSLDVPNAYESAKSFIFDKVKEAALD